MRSLLLLGIVLSSCAAPGQDITLDDGDFALLEFGLEDCTANDEHVGLEKFLRSLYGSRPQIDLDRQLARVKATNPTIFDFRGIADGFKRANTGLGSIRVTCRIRVSDRQMIIVPTAQALRLEGALPSDPFPRWRTFEVTKGFTHARLRRSDMPRGSE